MPATFQPFGFGVLSYEGGKTSYTMRDFPLSTTGMAANLGAGDSVTFSPGSTTVTGVQQMANTTNTTFNSGLAAAYTIGVVVEFSYTTPQNEKVVSKYWAANTPTLNNQAPIVTLNHLVNTVFRIQANAPFSASGGWGMNLNVCNNGATGAFVTPTPIATNVSQPNPATGESTQFLISSVNAGANAYAGQCKVIGLAPKSTLYPTNSWTDLYPIVLVRFNMHFLGAPTPSVI